MSTSSNSKLFGCNIHGSIRVSATALKIINTPEFQRMRSIKQLGMCSQVYPSATHTRFEHSIGVYYLAGKIVDKILQLYPTKEYIIPEISPGKTKLTNKIAECIRIAGLCHDIGHGPFSHIFDDVILKKSSHPNKHHETRSCLIVDMLCKRELADELDSGHIAFIKSLIDPQSHHKGAIYQIVANHLNGIDSDKFDYLQRDTRDVLGTDTGFNCNRLIDELIIDRNDNIAYPKHCRTDIYEMFHSRYMMHKKVYSHKTIKLIEQMFADMFIKIDPIFQISKSIEDMSHFCKLTDDSIFQYLEFVVNPPPFLQINLDPDQQLAVKEAYEIYQNMVSRKLYKQVFDMDGEENVEAFMEGFLEYLLANHKDFKKSDFKILRTKIGFVSGNKSDPFDSVYFYDKKENDDTFTVKKDNISGLMNNKLQETHWHFMCKRRSIFKTVLTDVKNYNNLLKKISQSVVTQPTISPAV